MLSITDRIYRALRREILAGVLKPGDSVSVRELARRFRGSRTPIREALIRLSHDRFVTIHPRRGAFVTGISIRQLHEVFQVRELLEGLAARLACQNPDKSVLDAFDDELKAARKSGKYQDLTTVGMKIHAWVSTAANNGTLTAILSDLHAHMARIFTLFVNDVVVTTESYGQYQAIIDAIRDNKPDEAEAAMRRHIALAKEQLLRTL
jgi:DNA-binding GntR family transcriptional regulator